MKYIVVYPGKDGTIKQSKAFVAEGSAIMMRNSLAKNGIQVKVVIEDDMGRKFDYIPPKLRPVKLNTRREFLGGMKVTELRSYASTLRVLHAWRLNKTQLVDAIMEIEKVRFK